MTWFLLALVAPFLYAITNYFDKILLQKYFKEGGVGTLILVSSFLSIIAIPVIVFADPTVLSVDGFHILILSIVAILDIAILWFYLLAMDGDEPSVVIVFYQLVPVFALILGFIFLDEVLSKMQIVAMAIIILGTSLISFEVDDEHKYRLRKKTIILMTFAALAWALQSVLFKVVALEENVWRSLFWEHVVLLIVGFLIFAFVPSYRRHFITALKANSVPIFAMNVLNEALYTVGNIVVAFAVLLAPVALVLLGESFQSLFVLLIGIFLTFFFPKIYSEDIKKKHIAQKLIAILITGIGTYILLS